jgi:hypothetical protein
MPSAAQRVCELFDAALARAPEEAMLRERPTRRLLGKGGSFDRIAPTQLLLESVERHLEATPLRRDPAILFLDFAGGGDGARAASALLGVLGARRLGGTLSYVAANTPPRGLGALVRSSLVDAGAGAGLSVEVVAHNRPLGAAELSARDLEEIAQRCALTISFASGGAAALFGPGDARLLELSHVCALTTPDPESLIAELPAFAAATSHDHGVDGVSFVVEVETDDAPIDRAEKEPSRAQLGRCALGPPEDDARERLWQLIDNAKRRRYRALVSPTLGGAPAGPALVCPCRRALERGAHLGVSTTRIVPSGNRLVAAGRGRRTLS